MTEATAPTNGNGNGNGTKSEEDNAGWMSDVQRAIALMLIGTLAVITLIAAVRLVIAGDGPTLTDMSKTLQSNLTNMALIALGFFFGNTMAKMKSDAGQQKVVEHLTGTPVPVVVPIPPTQGPPTQGKPWWDALNLNEQTAIQAAADAVPPDSVIAKFIATAKEGWATKADLVYLTSKGLLTEARAKEISP